MKTLYIVRHGKSSWDYDNVKDIDRPLKEKGIRDAAEMAGRLRDMGRKPERIISSPATRALHTATIFQRILQVSGTNFKLDEDIYDASRDDLLGVIYGIPDSTNSVMIFGHNPGMSHLAGMLTTLKLDHLPTTGLVIIDFETEKWTMINKQLVSYQYFDYPKKA